jgi:DNA repair exonuclease SbcCD ATPase subunit
MREAKRAIGSLKEIVAGLDKEMATLEALKEDMRKRNGMLEQLVIMRNAIGETQAELRMELVEAINSAMNGIWPILYPYADYRQLRIAASEEDYAFEVYDGEWRRLEKVASGGERACLSLTLRIAMATVLAPEAGWLILDEPTHNLDKEAVQALAEALENKVPQLVEQAFVITHEENLMNSEFARSYRFSREKEAGGATAVEEL